MLGPRPCMFSVEARNLEDFLWEDRDYSPDTEAMMYRFPCLHSESGRAPGGQSGHCLRQNTELDGLYSLIEYSYSYL